jgi:ATP-dependent RNA helicase DeaD
MSTEQTVQPQAAQHIEQIPANTNTAKSNTAGFGVFHLPPALALTLERMKYETPTPVQSEAIPTALQGGDVLGSAQTGTGKTGAFLIPTIARMLRGECNKALILTPTRELASQILVVLQQMLGQNRDLKTALLIGGDSMQRQFDQLKQRPRFIVGTPGRINDHLRRTPRLLEGTDTVVLDEADRMLDMGFSVQIDEILKSVSGPRQTLMFSATFPDSIIKFSKRYLNDPKRVSVNPAQVTASNIKHEILQTSEMTKYDDLVQQLDKRTGTIIVFVKTKHGADRLGRKLEKENHDICIIHGGLRQRQRDRAIQGFRAKKSRIMIATDVAARGLDVPHIEHVINYDLPQCAEDYVHRIGRTARAGAEGEAVAFLLPSERGKWAAIERILDPSKKSAGRGPNEDSRRSYGGNKRPAGQNSGGQRSEGRSYEGKRQGGYQGGGYKPAEGKKPWSDRPRRDDRPQHNDRPRNDDRPQQQAGDDFFGERGDQLVQLREAPKAPRRDDRPHSDRPQGDRPHREARPHGDRPQGNRPQGDRPQGDRPRGDRPQGARPYGDRPQGDRPRNDRPQGDRPYGDRPRRDDRPARAEGQARRPEGDAPWMKKRDDRSGSFHKPRPDSEGNTRRPPESFNDRDGNRKPAPPRAENDRDGNSAAPKREGFKKRSFDGKPGQGKPSYGKPAHAKSGGKPGGFSHPKRKDGPRNNAA